METKHTPTPWAYKMDDIVGKNGRIVHVCVRNDMTDKQDASFICRAVNSHSELLAAAKMAREKLSGYPAEKEVLALDTAIQNAEKQG